ncbi:NADP-dependent 3-hydroxy acid dehydrogenase YdfG [Pontibacter ummariensis]|uniref:NADP-dependent 3-hydroxy acid dehydrogenase YdfG n=1 Tax=Pontibacter ummariensis TaxID=1610492 RepID=A0A239DHP0_9BACT|nr:SDR family oxidoreductase [Pontibacter ummariensis]PRY14406.1 NADP-dependent 3-hydroxy acid dehydrogenase YdfG [Pontibacter ummariensis]SNS31243.1 NADP-dependent 3-hydroxy acid dehydrogenase YdfG [Pontibacter ummariensis]
MQQYILVTGGTKGIGRAVIEQFAKEGFHIITCSRNEKDLQKLKLEIEQDYTFSKVRYKEVDLSDRKSLKAFASFVKELGVKIDVLVNNSGLFIPGKITEEDDEALPFMINTNLYSAYYMTKAFVHDMIASRSGHIFNLCSTASITPYINGGSYCISKYAMYGMTKVLREELKEHNVRVTAILPGATLTASWEGVDLPPERFIKPADVAMAIWNAYTLSENSVVEELLIRPQLGDL